MSLNLRLQNRDNNSTCSKGLWKELLNEITTAKLLVRCPAYNQCSLIANYYFLVISQGLIILQKWESELESLLIL